jgi:hypothetical protein
VKLRIPVLVATCGAILLASVAAPADALAQRVAVRVAPRRNVVVGSRFYYSRPAFYSSWYFGYPWYDGYYGYYGYGYPYYGGPYRGYYDLSASMRLEVKPRETQVYVDGYYAGPVDDYDGVFQRLNIQPGEHEIELYLPGHRSLTQSVYLQPGRTVHIKHNMEPLRPGDPEPVPPAAETDRAITPSTPTQRAPVDVTRRPTGPTNAPRNAPGDRIVVNPPTSARDRDTEAYGSLALRVQPGPANVTIDGEKWEGPQDNERFVVQLPPGRHVIEVQKDGYRRYTTEVVVRSNETAPLNVALSKNQ